jgi:hypothetical protein
MKRMRKGKPSSQVDFYEDDSLMTILAGIAIKFTIA